MYIDTRLNKVNWDTRIRNVLYHIFAHLPRVPNEDEVSPNKLYLLIAVCLSLHSEIDRQPMWLRTDLLNVKEGCRTEEKKIKTSQGVPGSFGLINAEAAVPKHGSTCSLLLPVSPRQCFLGSMSKRPHTISVLDYGRKVLRKNGMMKN